MITPDEYRSRLLTKLNVLVAVLEVALAKIEKGMTAPGADEVRLEKISVNLKNTLEICHRAINTLERYGVGVAQAGKNVPSGAREYIEMSSIDEYRKFQSLPPIDMKDVTRIDLTDLCDRLQQ